jgi:hypothetical protein
MYCEIYMKEIASLLELGASARVKNMPRFIKFRKVYLIPLALLASSGAAIGLSCSELVSPRYSSCCILFGVFGPLVLNGILDSRLRLVIAKAGGLMCLSCGYRLFGLGERGLCPECGVQYEHDRCRSTWEQYGFYVARSDAATSQLP